MKKKFKATVAVDYDGTLVDWAFPKSGQIKAGAKAAMQALRKLGYRIVIHSCRNSLLFDCVQEGPLAGQKVTRAALMKDMRDTLDKAGVPYDEIDDGRSGKPIAAFYIDDRAIHFSDNWPKIQKAFEANK